MRSYRAHIRAFLELGKFRLSLLVVYSAVFGYLIGAEEVDFSTLLVLSFGGLLITMGANSYNEIIEADYDKLMNRTKGRPIPSGRLRSGQAIVFATFITLLGIHILTAFIGPVVGTIGLISVIIYVTIYTPLKRVSSLAVWVGTIPGALPLLIGWYSATKEFSLGGWILFLIQVLWQLSHFWTIAWIANEDYKKAGFYMLPLKGDKSYANAYIIAISVFPLLVLPFIAKSFNFVSILGAIAMFVITLPMALFAYKIILDKADENIKKLMLSSFLYLPLVYIIIYLAKILW